MYLAIDLNLDNQILSPGKLECGTQRLSVSVG